MKYLSLLLLISAVGFGKCETKKDETQALELRDLNTDVPAWLKDGVIVVRRADGKESKVSTNNFKVVPRKQQLVVTKTLDREVVTCGGQEESLPNRVSILGGAGPKGNLNSKVVSGAVQVSTDAGAVGGIQYQRKLGERLSIGAQVQTNDSASVILGVDF